MVRPRMRRDLRRLVLGVAAAALLLVVGDARPAGAKGPETLTISGPGIDEPIEVHLMGQNLDDTPSYLVVALTELAGPYDLTSRAAPRASTPSGDLRDRYTLTWAMSHPSDADPAAYTVVQDVYPDAAFGGPYIYLHANGYTGDAGGWYEAHPALRDTLAALGTPVARLATTAPTTPAAPPAPEATPAWPLPLAAATGLAAGAILGVVLTKRRLTPTATSVSTP